MDLIKNNPEAGQRVPLMTAPVPRIEWILVGWMVLAWFAYILFMRGDMRSALFFALPQGLAHVLTGQIDLDGPHRFWSDLTLASIGNLLYFVTGLWYIDRRNVEIPKAAWLPVAYALGLGLLTLPLEILAIFKLLSFASVIGTVVMTWAMLYFLTKEETLDVKRKSGSLGRWLAGRVQWVLRDRKTVGAESPAPAPPPPGYAFERFVWWAGLCLIVLMCFMTFYYAVFFPVIYTDALMYYVDYGYRTYVEHGFPEIVCAQVGIGLGANYPHLYPLAQATQAFLFRDYTDLYAQMMPPLAMALSTWLVYLILRDRIGNRAAAMAGAVVFRAAPHALTYSTWASDYPLAILYTAVLFYAGQLFLRSRNKSCLEVMMLAVAVAPHINYLMWVLWAPFILFLFAKPASVAQSYGVSMFRPGMRKQLFEVPPLWVLVFVFAAFLLGIPWYLRNEIVTGNPVYAFFPELFGGININLDVYESCFKEWSRNGEGIGRLAEAVWGASADGSKLDLFIQRLLVTPAFLFWVPPFHTFLSPLLTVLGIPGIVLAVRRGGVLGLGAVLLILILWAYECYSGLYLYQILIIVVPLIVAGALVFIEVQRLRNVLLVLCLLIGLFPGLPFSMVGAGKTRQLNPEFLTRSYAGDNNFMFYEQAFQGSGDAEMFRYFKEAFSESEVKVLTHENRRHVCPDTMRIVQLDDCEIQPLYDQPLPLVVRELQKMGIGYYLYVPNEDNHPVLKRLGIGGATPDPRYFALEQRFGDERDEEVDRRYALYRLVVE